MVRNYLPARSNLFAIQRFKYHCLSHKFNGKLKKNTGGERNNKYLSLQHFYLFLLQSSNIKIILPQRYRDFNKGKAHITSLHNFL